MIYEEKDILRLAKRRNNPKRSYLLVNPLQGKHIPVKPGDALAMLETLGRQTAEKYPKTKLVIGFAETATAIGAAVAGCFGEDCVYIHTTREKFRGDEKWIFFREEHSHAVEHQLCAGRLREWIRNAPQILFVDDELSTGRTMCNMVRQLRGAFPELEGRRMAAVSLINRMSEANMAALRAEGVECAYLLRIPQRDYTEAAAGFVTEEAVDLRGAERPAGGVEICRLERGFPEARLGISIGQYQRICAEIVDGIMPAVQRHLPPQGRVVVLGTEEFMYPALLLAQAAEACGTAASVRFHATTRSPIAISRDSGYPITSGYKISSFYEKERDTYVYNLGPCDTVVVLTDAGEENPGAVYELAEAARRNGCGDLLVLYGGKHV